MITIKNMEGRKHVLFRGVSLLSVCEGYLNPRQISGRRICYGVVQWCWQLTIFVCI